MTDHESREQLDRLIARFRDGECTDEERERLGELIAGDESARRRFVAHMYLSAALRDHLAAERTPPHPTSVKSPRRRSRRLWAAAIAAAALIAVLVSHPFRPTDAPTPPGPSESAADSPPVAVVTEARDIASTAGGASLHVGAGVSCGRLKFASGFLRLELDNGVEIGIAGPADVVLSSLERAVMYRGRLTVRVPNGMKCFRVETPTAEVVDLGTEFAVTVTSDGDSEMHVFDGKIEAFARTAQGMGPGRRLVKDQSARVTWDRPAVVDAQRDEVDVIELEKHDDGIAATSGMVRRLCSPPETVETGRFRDDCIMVFRERDLVTLPEDLEVNLAGEPFKRRIITRDVDAPYRTRGLAGDRANGYALTRREELSASVPKGTSVASYMIHFDSRNGLSPGTAGSVTFDRPIVAIICCHEQLLATDASLGADGTRYETSDVYGQSRQLDFDRLELSSDRKTLSMEWWVANSTDEVRVLVEADQAD